MDFFDIGPGELILILIVALVVMGPGKIVQVSRELGKMMHAFRKATGDLTTQITRELDVEGKESQHQVSKESQPPQLQENKRPPQNPDL